jgi:hypothetical protein
LVVLIYIVVQSPSYIYLTDQVHKTSEPTTNTQWSAVYLSTYLHSVYVLYLLQISASILQISHLTSLISANSSKTLSAQVPTMARVTPGDYMLYCPPNRPPWPAVIVTNDMLPPAMRKGRLYTCETPIFLFQKLEV